MTSLSIWALIAVYSVIFVGATVQGVAGFGLNLVAAPIVAAIEPSLVPSTMVLVSVPLLVSLISRNHRHIDWPSVGWVSLARVPGTLAAIALLGVVNDTTLRILVGVIVIAAVAVSYFANADIRATAPVSLIAGLFSGFMDTTAAVGGPPLALAYQNKSGEQLRSTISVNFAVGTAVSFGALVAAHKADTSDVVAALALWPAVVAGSVVAHRVHHKISSTHLKSMVLGLAGLAGILAIVSVLWR